MPVLWTWYSVFGIQGRMVTRLICLSRAAKWMCNVNLSNTGHFINRATPKLTTGSRPWHVSTVSFFPFHANNKREEKLRARVGLQSDPQCNTGLIIHLLFLKQFFMHWWLSHLWTWSCFMRWRSVSRSWQKRLCYSKCQVPITRGCRFRLSENRE